jgi:hypothetical protein
MSHEKELNELYSWEKEELEAIITSLQTLVDSKITEETIKTMNACERSLSIIREKYTSRLLNVYRRLS